MPVLRKIFSARMTNAKLSSTSRFLPECLRRKRSDRISKVGIFDLVRQFRHTKKTSVGSPPGKQSSAESAQPGWASQERSNSKLGASRSARTAGGGTGAPTSRGAKADADVIHRLRLNSIIRRSRIGLGRFGS